MNKRTMVESEMLWDEEETAVKEPPIQEADSEAVVPMEGAVSEESLVLSAQDEEVVERALNQRLADEFRELQGMFPQMMRFDEVPDSVIQEAVAQNRSLVDAYLRWYYAEEHKIQTARASAQTAAQASTGSLSGGRDASHSGVIEAMLRGVRSV